MYYMNRSFTCTYNGITPYLVTDAEIESVDKKYRLKIRALWDTGTNKTVISRDIAKELSLESVDRGFLGTASGGTPSDTYKVNIYLPSGIEVNNIEVIDGAIKPHDILIGMDIITQGDFAISNFNGKTTFIFRKPSIGSFHYGTSTESGYKKFGRNDPCPCGSGRKHKICCGGH